MRSLCAASPCLYPGIAQRSPGQIDPAPTASRFAGRHLGISTVRGVIEKTEGTVVHDPQDATKKPIAVSIDAASVNTRVDMRDKDLRRQNFLDVAEYSMIIFKSKRAEIEGEGKMKITADLTIQGVSKEVALEVQGQ
ncbi:MAG: YceI family protein [Acidobacteria bacterium]|nr:YceI family protein [Acidobacteriota bacterium]